MSCADIMTKEPAVLRAGESVRAAAEKLVAGPFMSLPVLDKDDRYAGMFGVRDLLSLLVPRVALAGNVVPNLQFLSDDPAELRQCYRSLKERCVGDFVDRGAPMLRPHTPEAEAIRYFCAGHNSLPVVEPETGKLVGIVSGRDAIRAIADASA